MKGLQRKCPGAPQVLEQYIKDLGGKRILRKWLIANNGMAATKAILSLRQWAYLESGLSESQVLHEPDDVTRPHRGQCPHLVRVAFSKRGYEVSVGCEKLLQMPSNMPQHSSETSPSLLRIWGA